MNLAPLGDLDAFTATRSALHAVAEHVLAAYRYRADGHIGLVVTDGGFGTPPLEHGTSVRVDGNDLVVAESDGTRREPLTTLAAAAAACGIEPGAPDVYTPVTPLTADAPLPLDPTAAERVASWLAFAWARLVDLARSETSPILWPEHFDAAVELGDEERDARGTFGASPGDAEHPVPYLYITHWADTPDDPFWNDAVFPGASLSYDALLRVDDPVAAADDFFTTGRAILERR